MAATDYATEQQAIMTRLESQWAERTPIAWPNSEYPPKGTANSAYDGVTYIEPIVNRQDAFNADISTTRRVRHPGLLTVNVRVAPNTGDETALEYGDLIAAIYRNVTFSGITFRAPTVRDIGREGPWYRVQVDCPFWRDSIH